MAGGTRPQFFFTRTDGSADISLYCSGTQSTDISPKSSQSDASAQNVGSQRTDLKRHRVSERASGGCCGIQKPVTWTESLHRQQWQKQRSRVAITGADPGFASSPQGCPILVFQFSHHLYDYLIHSFNNSFLMFKLTEVNLFNCS